MFWGLQEFILQSLSRCPSSTLLPFLFGGLLIKTEQREKGFPSYSGFTEEPSCRMKFKKDLGFKA